MVLGGLIGRFAGQNMMKAFQLGGPKWSDVAMNALPSVMYGGSLMMQGANPMEAGGTALSDLGLQMVADTALGTLGSRLGMATASRAMKDRMIATGGDPTRNRKFMQRANQWGNVAKMGSMATMFMPNPVANSFYERMKQQQDPASLMEPLVATTSAAPEEDPYTAQMLAQMDPQTQQYAAALMGGYG
jgi:hypothetical protein